MYEISHAIAEINDKLPSIIYKLDEPMRNHTTFRVGGPVRAMFLPDNSETLVELCKLLSECGVESLVIGNGSNMLVSDSPLDLVVVKTTGLDGIELSGDNDYAITAGAGVPLSKLAEFAQNNALKGLEFAYGIPGSVGGAVSMNAGAYGSEMKDVVYSTTIVSTGKGTHAISGEGTHTITGGEHGFRYRSSRFSNTGDIIVSSTIKLAKGNKDEICEKMNDLSAKRSASQPLEASAGSTFKRPKNDCYAASLIEQAGLKGFTIGDAQVSEKHSGFIVNRGSATFSDIIKVIEYVQKTVFAQFQIELEPEVKIIR